MNAKIFGSIRVALTAVLLVAVLIITSASCTRESFEPPTASNPSGEGLMEVDVMDYFRDFKTDPVAAAAKYGDRDLHFKDIVVDQMAFLGEPVDLELYVQWGIDPDRGQVRFRTEKLSDIINVRDTYVVEIVGRAIGMKFNYISVEIVWLRVTDPPGGDPDPPSEY